MDSVFHFFTSFYWWKSAAVDSRKNGEHKKSKAFNPLLKSLALQKFVLIVDRFSIST